MVAIFAVTTDPFIILTSNILAILGLRAMHFLLTGVAERVVQLKCRLALILMFIGLRLLLRDILPIPTGLARGSVALLLASSMVLSVWVTPSPDGVRARRVNSVHAPCG